MSLARSPQNSGKNNILNVLLADLEVATLDLIFEDSTLISESLKSKCVFFENLGLFHWSNLSIWCDIPEPCWFIWVDNGIEFKLYQHQRIQLLKFLFVFWALRMLYFVVEIWQEAWLLFVLLNIGVVFEIICWSQGALQNLRVWGQLWEASNFILNFASNALSVITISLHVKPIVWASKGDKVSHWVLNVARLNNVSSDKGALG